MSRFSFHSREIPFQPLSGCSRKTSIGGFHDDIHANDLDERCWTLHDVLQAILFWGSGLRHHFRTENFSNHFCDSLGVGQSYCNACADHNVCQVNSQCFLFIFSKNIYTKVKVKVIIKALQFNHLLLSVSNDLPRTSYMKMVDIWLIFNLFIPFLEVLLHTYKVSLILFNTWTLP